MQNEVTFIIADGRMTYLLTKAAPRLEGAVIRRASHVEPVPAYLRLAFRAIRKLVADDSRIATWTREWPCMWQVDMSPVGGGILRWKDLPHNACMAKYGDWGGNEVATFSNRQIAIDAEVEALNNHFIGEQS